MSREFVIRPNCSLSSHSRRNFLLGLSLLMLVIASGLALQGMWVVTPFLGADLLLVIYAFVRIGKQCQIRERVVITHDALTIHHEEDTAPRSWSFPLYWVRVDLRPVTHAPSHGSRLLIGMHDNWVELASFLTQDERTDLASALRAAIIAERQPQSGHVR